MIFEPDLETLPRAQLRALQLERLRGLVDYVKERVPLYRDRLAGVEPGDIRSLDDLRRFPFTRKDDLRDTYPFGMFAVPREEIIRVHASSGTTGKLTVVGYTAADVDLFARVNARSLAMAGAEPGMVLHNAYGYGLFTGGLGLHYGGERLGLAVVPVSGGMTERQLMLITDFRPDLISCTPSYGLTLAQAFRDRGIAPEEISLRYAVLGAEPWTDAMRREIDAGLGVRSTNIFGLSEVIGPGVSCDDMLIIRGVNVYPTQVEAALLELEELTPNYLIVVTRPGTLDEAEVEVEVSEAFLREAGTDSLSDELEHVRALRGRAEARLRETIGCSLSVTFKPPGTVPRSEGGKLQRVLDRRTPA